MYNQYAMFTETGNILVSRIVLAAYDLAVHQVATNRDITGFVSRELSRLASTEDYAEAGDTAVREAVYSALAEAIDGYQFHNNDSLETV